MDGNDIQRLSLAHALARHGPSDESQGGQYHSCVGPARMSTVSMGLRIPAAQSYCVLYRMSCLLVKAGRGLNP
jgi:hypothetical protein